MPAPHELTSVDLLCLVGTPDCPAIIDISIDPDFDDDPFLIPGSARHPHTDIPGLLARLGGRPCVICCQKGAKLSQGVTAWLRTEGVDARYLAGGKFGWRETKGAPCVPAQAVPEPVGGATLWVTDRRPAIDAMACAWLIRRFVDAAARFLFVSPAEVAGVAERFGATPFAVEGALGFHRGDGCSFDTMLGEFGLGTQPLERLSTIIGAAELDRLDLAREAAGLLAVSAGLSRLCGDPVRQLDAGLGIYDALYLWAKDRCGEDGRPRASAA